MLSPHTSAPALSTPGALSSQVTVSSTPLGRGSFGAVYRGTFSGSAVAVKVCAVSPRASERVARSAATQFRRETARYQQLRHPCITQFFCVVQHAHSLELLLVTELMRGGSLFDALGTLSRHGVRALPHEAVLRLARHVVSGLAYLHASDFSFGDLKTMNVLLSEPVDVASGNVTAGAQAKLCDFGLSRNLKHLVAPDASPREGLDESVIPGRNGPAGTFAYLAPEAFGGLPTDDADAPRQADVYALAVVLWELATLQRPWPRRRPLELIRLVQREGKRPEWPEEVGHLPEGYVELVERCWVQEAWRRPSVDEVAQELEMMYERVPQGKEKGRWSSAMLPAKGRSVISRASEESSGSEGGEGTGGEETSGEETSGEEISGEETGGEETVGDVESFSEDIGVIEVDEEELLDTLDIPLPYRDAIRNIEQTVAVSPLHTFSSRRSSPWRARLAEAFSPERCLWQEPWRAVPELPGPVRQPSRLRMSMTMSSVRRIDMGGNATMSTMPSVTRTTMSTVSMHSVEGGGGLTRGGGWEGGGEHSRRYSVPMCEKECEQALEMELQRLEDEERLDLCSAGVSMFTRPHFR